MKQTKKRPISETKLLKRKIQKLSKKVEELQEENKTLKQLLQEFREKFFGKKKKKEDKEPEKLKKKKKRGAPFGHKGITRKTPDHIDEYVEVKLDKCPHCQSTHLTPLEETYDHTQEDIVVEPRIKVTCYQHQLYYCKGCKKSVYADAGEGELPGSYIGPVAKSIANYLHYQFKLPYRKIKTFFKELFKFDFSHTSAVGFDNQTYRKGKTTYNKMEKKLPNQPFVHVDETGWKKDGINYWLWCFGSPEYILFHIDKRRSGKVVTERLGNSYNGVLISDFLSAYNKIQCRKQRCLVHLLRLVKKWIVFFEQDKKRKRFFETLKILLKEILKYSAKKIIDPSPEEIDRQADWIARLRRLLRTSQDHKKADDFLKRLINKFEELITCLKIPEIEAHNNTAERILRDSVIMRKITFCNRSEQGALNHSVLMSLIQTARLHQLNPLGFLHLLLTNTTAAAKAINIE
ncbi:MAG: IS66 family transposase [Deltaproteobacteria bacterium]|nr:IS66 family transposase [Deltaproteobacteria bacterium]